MPIKPTTAIAKGKQLESYIAERIESKGLGKARRSIGSGSGNREKSDIDTNLMILGKNIGIESKNYSNAHIKDWWKQTCKLEELGREPVLVYKLKGESLGDAKAVIWYETLLDLIKASQTPKIAQHDESREGKWIIKNAITALNKLLKYLEK